MAPGNRCALFWYILAVRLVPTYDLEHCYILMWGEWKAWKIVCKHYVVIC